MIIDIKTAIIKANNLMNLAVFFNPFATSKASPGLMALPKDTNKAETKGAKAKQTPEMNMKAIEGALHHKKNTEAMNVIRDNGQRRANKRRPIFNACPTLVTLRAACARLLAQQRGMSILIGA